MEPEGSLPRLQVPTTCPFSKPDRSNPSPQTARWEMNLYKYAGGGHAGMNLYK